MLGSGFISEFYASSIQGQRNDDTVVSIASRSEKNVKKFAAKYACSHWSTKMDDTFNHPDVDLVCVGLPNFLHEEAVLKCAAAGKGVICTKPLGRNAKEAHNMLRAVEEAGIYHGYMKELLFLLFLCWASTFLKRSS